jgi:hypothetical protein
LSPVCDPSVCSLGLYRREKQVLTYPGKHRPSRWSCPFLSECQDVGSMVHPIMWDGNPNPSSQPPSLLPSASRSTATHSSSKFHLHLSPDNLTHPKVPPQTLHFQFLLVGLPVLQTSLEGMCVVELAGIGWKAMAHSIMDGTDGWSSGGCLSRLGDSGGLSTCGNNAEWCLFPGSS